MNCQQCQELLDNLLVAEPTTAERATMAEHLEKCPDCARQYAQARQALAAITPAGPFPVSSDLKERIMAAISDVEARRMARQHPSMVRANVSKNFFLEQAKTKILIYRHLGIATAAMMALAAGVICYVSLGPFPTAAYALEQIAKAYDHVTSYHSKETYVNKGIIEAWVQLDQEGNLLHLRMDYPKTSEGPKSLIWSKEKAEIWVKATNSHYTLNDKARAKWEGIAKNRHLFDPKFTVEKLQAQRAAGKVTVTVKESTKEGEPTVLTVVSTGATDARDLLEVDPKTKLVKRLTIEHRHNDQWKPQVIREYFDYGKPIDPKVFQPE